MKRTHQKAGMNSSLTVLLHKNVRYKIE